MYCYDIKETVLQHLHIWPTTLSWYLLLLLTLLQRPYIQYMTILHMMIPCNALDFHSLESSLHLLQVCEVLILLNTCRRKLMNYAGNKFIKHNNIVIHIVKQHLKPVYFFCYHQHYQPHYGEHCVNLCPSGYYRVREAIVQKIPFFYEILS